jgi:Head domain of trimeric autotransporter adhesin
MKLSSTNRLLFLPLVLGFTVLPLAADPSSVAPDGLFLGKPGTYLWNTYLQAWDSGTSRRSIEMAAVSGGIYLYSGDKESIPGAADGGITLDGGTISLVLNGVQGPNGSNTNFDVWRGSAWGIGQPLFNINGLNGSTTFTNSNVAINNGTLTVAGSPVLTQSSAPAAISGLGFLKNTEVSVALNSATPPTSAAWLSAYIPRGNVGTATTLTEKGNLALGSYGTSIASGSNAIASGHNATASGMFSIASGTNALASGVQSVAIGQNATATGMFSQAIGNTVSATGAYSYARGSGSTAAGVFSNAIGYQSSARGRAEFVVGTGNLESPTVSNGFIANSLNGLFRVGNGVSSARSDAMTVLFNGQTTLTNKEWKTATSAAPASAAAALANPASTTDSDGNALVVEGHTLLKGKVTLAVPQGDISMGIYQ